MVNARSGGTVCITVATLTRLSHCITKDTRRPYAVACAILVEPGLQTWFISTSEHAEVRKYATPSSIASCLMHCRTRNVFSTHKHLYCQHEPTSVRVLLFQLVRPGWLRCSNLTVCLMADCNGANANGLCNIIAKLQFGIMFGGCCASQLLVAGCPSCDTSMKTQLWRSVDRVRHSRHLLCPASMTTTTTLTDGYDDDD